MCAKHLWAEKFGKKLKKLKKEKKEKKKKRKKEKKKKTMNVNAVMWLMIGLQIASLASRAKA